jgi:hypothetical protein
MSCLIIALNGLDIRHIGRNKGQNGLPTAPPIDRQIGDDSVLTTVDSVRQNAAGAAGTGAVINRCY